MNYVRASEHDQILLSFSKLNYLQPYHFKIDANPLCAQKNIYFTTKNDYYMTYPYSNINRSHYDPTAEQQSKEITAHKIYFHRHLWVYYPAGTSVFRFLPSREGCVLTCTQETKEVCFLFSYQIAYLLGWLGVFQSIWIVFWGARSNLFMHVIDMRLLSLFFFLLLLKKCYFIEVSAMTHVTEENYIESNRSLAHK